VSLLSFKFSFLGLPLLILVGVATFIISLKNLEWGIYILFGELFVGSRGRLIELDLVSLRMVIFAAVFAAWIINIIQKSKIKNQNDNSKFKIPDSKFYILYSLLLIAVGWGIVNGILADNGLRNVFLDANGYLYLLILPAVVMTIRKKAQLENLLQILGAAIIVIGLKTFVLFLWFAYGFAGVATLYHWIIDFDIGEITGVVGSASRIFMQSQFFALSGLFIFSLLYFDLSRPPATLSSPGEGLGERSNRWQLIIIAAAVLSIIISLSRSFWLGGFAAAVFADIVLIFYLKVKLRSVIKWGFSILGIAILQIGLLFGLTQLSGKGFSETVLSRGLNPAQEAAGGARLLLLPELLDAIKKSPIIGSGFGKEVSYKSYLPDRTTPENPQGVVTNYAFEWGYLDIILKVGLLGALIYLLFIAHIFRMGWGRITYHVSRITNFGILCGLVALVVLNITTPYLNHPLGIGYLIFSYLAFRNHE
ncbi:MAG: O-antigen ligase family protein, partial [bacterium]|nr:O-antigen ligase family protein [bacterium]